MGKRLVVVLLPLLLVGSVAGLVWLAVSDGPAVAGTASDFAKSSNSELVKYLQSGAALNLRQIAAEVLRKKSGSTSDLVTVAKGGDLAIAVYATSALGRQNTSDSRTALKDLVTDTKLGAGVRKAAMNSLALNFKSADDLDWLTEKVGSDSALKGQLAYLKTYVYEK